MKPFSYIYIKENLGREELHYEVPKNFEIIDLMKKKLKLISSNIRFDNENDGDHIWDNRKYILRDSIQSFDPHILGTQEGRRPQLSSLDSLLDDQDIVDSHRAWIKERMYPSLFLNSKDLIIKKSGDIWLSETPSVPGSKSFDSAFPRLCSWASVLWPQSSGNEGVPLFIVNCHLDHVLEKTRNLQVEVLCKEVFKIRDEEEHLIIMGDFNSHPESEVRKVLLTFFPCLYDPWKSLGLEEEASHHKFGKERDAGSRIDWIMVDKRFEAEEIYLDKIQKEGLFPSDHYPLKCTLKLN